MSNISFGSTYRISVSQPGVNAAKKERLRTLIESYPNGLIGKSKLGYARVSMPNEDDAEFIAKLKRIGYKIYQKFDGENIDKHKIDAYIKENLEVNNFQQKGKNPPKLSKAEKEKRRSRLQYNVNETKQTQNVVGTKKEIAVNNEPEFISMNLPTKEQIRMSDTYLRLLEEEGKEFAEAVFFGIKK